MEMNTLLGSLKKNKHADQLRKDMEKAKGACKGTGLSWPTSKVALLRMRTCLGMLGKAWSTKCVVHCCLLRCKAELAKILNGTAQEDKQDMLDKAGA